MTLPEHPYWIQTHGGTAFDLLAPTPEMVSPLDVAHALARINRFGGHADRAFSVAQHSLLVAELMVGVGERDPRVLLQGLVHDAAEAFAGDVTAPLKALLPEYRAIEARVWRACAEQFGVGEALHENVKCADRLACRLEAHAHLPGEPLGGWAGPDPAEHLWEGPAAVLRAIRPAHEWSYRWFATFTALQTAESRAPVEAPLARWVGL